MESKPFLRKLSKLGCRFRKETRKSKIYREPGSSSYISIPKGAWIEDAMVWTSLRRLGVSEDDIKEFIAENS